MTIKKIAGIVVLYNPITDEALDNINSYIDEIDALYIFDNSSCEHEEFKKIKKAEYIPLLTNRGLSFALNEGCQKAIAEGATILVTFDQDTYFEQGCISTLTKYIFDHKHEICCASPNAKRIIRLEDGSREVIEEPLFSEEIEEVDWVITSGCVFTKETYESVGGFDSKLFIAQIDQDFSYRIKNFGGHVIRYGNCYMHQELGNAVKHKFLRKTVYSPNQSPLRYYYVFRNERYLRDKWGGQYKRYYAPLHKYIATVVLFENQKFKKLWMMLKGYITGI